MSCFFKYPLRILLSPKNILRLRKRKENSVRIMSCVYEKNQDEKNPLPLTPALG